MFLNLNNDGKIEKIESKYNGKIEKNDDGYCITMTHYIESRKCFIELSTTIDSLENLSNNWYNCNIKYYNMANVDKYMPYDDLPENLGHMERSAFGYFTTGRLKKNRKKCLLEIESNIKICFELGKAMNDNAYLKSIFKQICNYELIDTINYTHFDLNNPNDRFNISYSRDKEHSKKNYSRYKENILINPVPIIVDGVNLYRCVVEFIDGCNTHKNYVEHLWLKYKKYDREMCFNTLIQIDIELLKDSVTYRNLVLDELLNYDRLKKICDYQCIKLQNYVIGFNYTYVGSIERKFWFYYGIAHDYNMNCKFIKSIPEIIKPRDNSSMNNYTLEFEENRGPKKVKVRKIRKNVQ